MLLLPITELLLVTELVVLYFCWLVLHWCCWLVQLCFCRLVLAVVLLRIMQVKL